MALTNTIEFYYAGENMNDSRIIPYKRKELTARTVRIDYTFEDLYDETEERPMSKHYDNIIKSFMKQGDMQKIFDNLEITEYDKDKSSKDGRFLPIDHIMKDIYRKFYLLPDDFIDFMRLRDDLINISDGMNLRNIDIFRSVGEILKKEGKYITIFRVNRSQYIMAYIDYNDHKDLNKDDFDKLFNSNVIQYWIGRSRNYISDDYINEVVIEEISFSIDRNGKPTNDYLYLVYEGVNHNISPYMWDTDLIDGNLNPLESMQAKKGQDIIYQSGNNQDDSVITARDYSDNEYISFLVDEVSDDYYSVVYSEDTESMLDLYADCIDVINTEKFANVEELIDLIEEECNNIGIDTSNSTKYKALKYMISQNDSNLLHSDLDSSPLLPLINDLAKEIRESGKSSLELKAFVRNKCKYDSTFNEGYMLIFDDMEVMEEILSQFEESGIFTTDLEDGKRDFDKEILTFTQLDNEYIYDVFPIGKLDQKEFMKKYGFEHLKSLGV